MLLLFKLVLINNAVVEMLNQFDLISEYWTDSVIHISALINFAKSLSSLSFIYECT